MLMSCLIWLQTCLQVQAVFSGAIDKKCTILLSHGSNGDPPVHGEVHWASDTGPPSCDSGSIFLYMFVTHTYCNVVYQF